MDHHCLCSSLLHGAAQSGSGCTGDKGQAGRVGPTEITAAAAALSHGVEQPKTEEDGRGVFFTRFVQRI